MNQQLLVLKEKNDLLKDLIGLSYNQKVKSEAYKILNEIHKDYQPGMAKALVYCYDPKSKEIFGIGGSSLLQDRKNGRIFSDLINDNFGKYFATHFSPVQDANRNVTLQDITGSPEIMGILRSSGTSYNLQIGTQVQVGQGSTAPARTDITIETPFANTGPEDVRNNVAGTGGYNASLGLITISTNISPTGGAGTVTESTMFSTWFNFGFSLLKIFLLSRDLISPGVSFIAAQTITVDYLWQI